MTASSAALAALAALLKSGLSLRQALLAWPDELTGDHRAEAREVVRRLELGYPVRTAIEASSLAWVLEPAFSVHLATGVDLVAWLERIVSDREETAGALKAARGAAAGAALSGRMVAGLPLLFVPLTPVSRAPLTDPVGLTMLSLGVVLAVAGLRWIGRLLPQPATEDAAAELAMLLAAMLRAGLPVAGALGLVCGHRDAPPSLVRAGRLVTLGATWQQALKQAGDESASLAAAIGRAQRFGIPAADALESHAAARRAEIKRDFEEKLRRAPVLMVVPLTCCILPAYGLLALGPFVRSMSLG